MTNQKITIQLLPLSLERAGNYLRWFNDVEVNRYLLSTTPKTKSDISNWLKETIKDKNSRYFSIFLPAEKLFIGHVGLKKIDKQTYEAEIGIVIGEKKL